MERFDDTLRWGRKPIFDQVPASRRRRLFGVDYVHLTGRQSGDLFVTRHGWGVVDSLLPEHWFTGRRFSKVGRALAGATGAVYRVPVPHPGREDFALVVKFSRFCQTLGVTGFDPRLGLSAEDIDRIRSAPFLSPFAEFGHLCQLREAAGLTIPTKAPLAIYCPPTRYLAWQLGREGYLQDVHTRQLDAAQSELPPEQRLKYDWERQYILLYRWLGGIDAEQAMDAGWISEAEMIHLGREARVRLADLGWEVMDHKPRHVIVRRNSRGGLARRRGEVLWGLLDYELLYPFRGASLLTGPTRQSATPP